MSTNVGSRHGGVCSSLLSLWRRVARRSLGKCRAGESGPGGRVRAYRAGGLRNRPGGRAPPGLGPHVRRYGPVAACEDALAGGRVAAAQQGAKDCRTAVGKAEARQLAALEKQFARNVGGTLEAMAKADAALVTALDDGFRELTGHVIRWTPGSSRLVPAHRSGTRTAPSGATPSLRLSSEAS